MACEYESPNDRISRPGQPALQQASEAMNRQELHDQWHRDHPGEWDCPAELNQPGDYDRIARAARLGGGETFQPGDAFVFGSDKE